MSKEFYEREWDAAHENDRLPPDYKEGIDAVAKAAQPSEVDAELMRLQKALDTLGADIDRLAGGIEPVLSEDVEKEPEGLEEARPSCELGRRIRALRDHADALGSYVARLSARIQL